MSSVASVAVLTGTVTQGQLPKEIALENVTVTPTDSVQTITAGEGYDGLGTVTVEASSGGTDTLDEMFNSNTPISFTMTDNNQNHACFGYSASLYLTLPSTITEIVNNAFNASNLYSISGSGVTTIGAGAFFNANSLVSVNFPNVTTLGYECFAYSSIPSIRLEVIQNLPDNCFAGCSSLHDVYLGYDGVVGFSTDPLSVFTEMATTITVHVPANRLSDYENNTDWQSVVDATDVDYTVVLVGDYSAE